MAAVSRIQVSGAIDLSKEQCSPEHILDKLCHQSLTSNRAALIADATGLLPPLAKMVTEFALETFPTAVFGWYIAFKKLYGRETVQLPALPPNIVEILNSPLNDQETEAWGTKEDGSRYLVREIYSLRLVHKGSLNDYEERLIRYRKDLGDPNTARVLQFEYFWAPAKTGPGDVAAERWGWALVSNDVLPQSRYKSFEEQTAMLPNNCELATFPIACTSVLDHALATGERLLKEEDDLVKVTFTRVSTTIDNHFLIVGRFGARGGLGISVRDNLRDFNIGAIVMRKFL